MKTEVRILFLTLLFSLFSLNLYSTALEDGSIETVIPKKQKVKVLYIPLADHYPAVIAYDKYKDQMQLADYEIEQMKSWLGLRARFYDDDVDVACIISPMAMDMFHEKQNFRWISLIHRDGNALAVNDILKQLSKLPEDRKNRKPDSKIADAFSKASKDAHSPVVCGVPSLLATHTVVLYKFLKDNGIKLDLGTAKNGEVVAIEVPPPKSPAFIKRYSRKGRPASFEQSLPWADIVETGLC
jgi:NitT/TauT family transport system substrate-binding protein